MQHVVVLEAPRRQHVVCDLMQSAAAAFSDAGLADLCAYVARRDSAYVVVAFREGAKLPAERLADFVEAAALAGARIVDKTPEDLLLGAQRGDLCFFFGTPSVSAIDELFAESDARCRTN